MKKHYSYSLFLLIAIITLTFCSSSDVLARTIPNASSEFYVNDSAGLLDSDTQQYILTQSVALSDNTGAQVVLATIKSLEGDAIEEYATAMFRQYGIGQSNENNGILILLSLEDREVRIEVGYGLEGAINDAKAGRIIREIGTPFLREDNWNEGLKAIYSSVLNEVYLEYKLEPPTNLDPIRLEDRANDSGSGNGFGGISFVVLIILLVLFGRGRGGRGGFWGGGFGGGHFGGGGFGGGGGFSGGGGSSGGGGASGKF